MGNVGWHGDGYEPAPETGNVTPDQLIRRYCLPHVRIWTPGGRDGDRERILSVLTSPQADGWTCGEVVAAINRHNSRVELELAARREKRDGL